jgi:hypothetical protein
MSSMKMQHTRDRLAKIYGAGVLAFSVMVGFVTVLAIFLAQVKLD